MGLKPHANPKRQRRGSARGQVCNFQFCDGQSRVACSATLGVPKAASDAAIWVRGVCQENPCSKGKKGYENSYEIPALGVFRIPADGCDARSEEHTSELQSPMYL